MLALRVTAERVRSDDFISHHKLGLPDRPSLIAVEEDHRAEGNFGAVHTVLDIDGAALAQPLLLKISSEDSAPDGAADSLAPLIRGLEQLPPQIRNTWPERLLALPFWIGVVDVPGRGAVEAALMLDLAPLGYRQIPFGTKPDDFDALDSFNADYRAFMGYLTGEERNTLAHSLAASACLLELVGFLHADINPANVQWSEDRLDVQLLDFDGGVMKGNNAQALPAAIGKRDLFLPPEVAASAVGGTAPDAQLMTLEAERWSIAMMIGHIVCGSWNPLVFLSPPSPSSVEAFAASRWADEWPHVDLRSLAIFADDRQTETAVKVFCARVDDGDISPEVVALLRQTFRAGLDGATRPTAADWVDALNPVREPPEVLLFTVDPAIAIKGSTARLAWSVGGATSAVTIEPFGEFQRAGEHLFIPNRPLSISLFASNRWGTVELRGLKVHVVELPDHVSRRFDLPPRSRRPAIPSGLDLRENLPQWGFDLPESHPIELPRSAEFSLPNFGPDVFGDW